MAAASPTPALTPTFYQDFGITRAQFQAAFDVQSDGTFKLKPGWSLQFTHAELTTGDRATTVVRQGQVATGPALHTGSAGELWKKCRKQSVRDETCCVFNCPNPQCTPTSPQKAGATAHVYATFQKPGDDIRFMILLPTCSYDNHAWQAFKSETTFPQPGQQAYMLCTVIGARMIFIEVNAKTEAKKGGKGKGTGKGGGYKGHYPPGAPPGANLI